MISGLISKIISIGVTAINNFTAIVIMAMEYITTILLFVDDSDLKPLYPSEKRIDRLRN